MRRVISKMSTDAHLPKGSFDTIIIGAGIAGLACASRLRTSNAQSKLCVLEARDRIGGRIGSVWVNGSRLDVGANWIHGTGTEEEPNPLMDILPHKRYRELSRTVAFRPAALDKAQKQVPSPGTDENDEWEDLGPALATTVSEDLVIPASSAAALTGTLYGTIGALHEFAADTSSSEASRTSMLSALTQSEAFRRGFDAVEPDLHPVLSGMPQFIENMEAAPLAAQSAEHTEGTPGMSLAEFAIDDFDGGQVFLQDGYLAIVQEIAKPLIDAGSIHTGVEVQQIDWTANPISVVTSKGVYHAKNVVCTIPLGVLKHRIRESTSSLPLFNPSLPKEKTQAISSLGFGTLDKVFLVYSEPWWTMDPFKSIVKKGVYRRPFTSGKDEDSDSGNGSQEPDSFMGFTHELAGFSISQSGEVTIGPRLLSIVNLHSLCGFPALCAFLSCSNAAQMEALSDEKVAAIVQRSLTAWFGRSLPKPDAVHLTRWASDPYALGSYTHMITGSSKTEHREEFQKPLGNEHGGQLSFAGEHTSKNHFATVHGALLSGWREADNIISSAGLS
ncbi:amine oxidase [Neohortaea acidophila]|uniref:Amine oxidase n=1 Tax=Neohortaea acidophila TaxID=245834 RepID=A0A6A6Q135_9PEZI|nr:amine oxidase [Neohortaea acidophila]KAF2485706.1 amine oxidase [Neohortaea acidophila]